MAAAVLAAPADALASSPGCTAVKAGTYNGNYSQQGPLQFSGGEKITFTSLNPSSGFTAAGLALGTGPFSGEASISFTDSPITYFDSDSYPLTVTPGQEWVKWGTAFDTETTWSVSCVAPPPTLSAISPSVVLAAGDTGVTITGTNLLGATEVLFDGVAASGFAVNSATQISALEPAHAVGTVDVTVMTPEGTPMLAGALTYANPPNAPTGVSATAGGGQASVAFTAPINNGGSAITKYIVTSNPGGKTAEGGASPLTVTGLTNGTSYTFTVTATNAVGTSAASAASNAVTIKSGQTITFNDPGAQAFGTAPTLTATSTSGLVVSFSSSTTGVCTITSGGTLTFITTGSCTINADQAGDGTFAAATTVTQTFTVEGVSPSPPTGVLATVSSGIVTITFVAPSATGGLPITGYEIYQSPGILVGTTAGTSYSVSGLASGASYSFLVKAKNGAGISAYSATSNAVTLPAAPVAGAVSATVAVNSSANPITLNLSGGAATSVAVVGAASHGTATASGTSVSYTPTAGYSGSDSFTYTAANAGGTSSEATVSITVSPPVLVLTPASLPAATVGTAYSTTLLATGGTAPYTYAITAGALPAGLSFNTATGVLSGTPTTLGTANFTVTATDQLLVVVSHAYSLSIGKATPSVLLSASITSPLVGQSVTLTASVTGNASPTGTVTFTEGGTTLGSATLSSGAASLSTSSLAAGAHTIVALYGGDGLNQSVSSSTVTVSVVAPTLTLTPGSGGVAPAKVGVAYDLPITIGGVGGSSSFTTSGLPPGLSLVETDAAHVAISGTPTATGAYTITVNASSGGATGSAIYALSVTAATPALSLTASPTSAAVGETVTLTATLSGGASPTGSIDLMDGGAWQATMPLVGTTQVWTLPALAPGNHAFSVAYSGDLANAPVTSSSVTVSIGAAARPDPGQDQAATAIVTSQAATASRVGQRQIGNTIQRLEQLHDEGTRPSGHAGNLVAESDGRAPSVRPAGDGYATSMLAYGDDTASSGKAGPGEAASQIFSKVSQAFEAAEQQAELPFHLWSAGTVDWGRAGEGGDERFTTSGLTFGVDRRLTDSLTMGLAGGIAVDHTRFGRDTSDGTAYTAQLYASLKLAPQTWLDVVGGYGALQFDSERWAGGGLLTGDRDGSNLFGSVGLSSAYDVSGLKLTGYGRLDIVRLALDGYTEGGSPTWALAYDDMDSTTLTGVAGLRASYPISMDWGTLTPGGRIEYRHALEGGFTQSLGYADVGGFGAAISGDATTRDSATFGLGLSATTLDGLDLDLDYRLSTDGDGIGSQQVRAGFRLPF